MKHADLLVAFFIVVLVGALTPAHAADAERRAAFLQKWDSDGDGQLNESERAALQAKRNKRRGNALQRFDADGDGQLSDSERADARAQRDTKRAELLQQFDADGDRRLGQQERQTARDSGALKRHGQRGGRGSGKPGG